MNLFSKSHEYSLRPAPIPERLLKNQKVAIITADEVEDLEFFYPLYRFTEEGYEVDVITRKGEKIKGKHDYEFESTKAIEDVKAYDYALLYIPGGAAPKELRQDEKILDFVRDFVEHKKPIAAICHGAQVLISANVIAGKKIAAWPEIKDEVETDGKAIFADEALAEDGIFITSRRPGDLHRHMSRVIEILNGTASVKKAGNMNEAILVEPLNDAQRGKKTSQA